MKWEGKINLLCCPQTSQWRWSKVLPVESRPLLFRFHLAIEEPQLCSRRPKCSSHWTCIPCSWRYRQSPELWIITSISLIADDFLTNMTWHLNFGNEAVSDIIQLGTESVNLKMLLKERKRNWKYLGVNLQDRPLDSVIFGDKGQGKWEHGCGAAKITEKLSKLQIFTGEDILWDHLSKGLNGIVTWTSQEFAVLL